MTVRYSKPLRILFLATLLLCNAVVMCDCVFYPTINALYARFADTPRTLVDLIVSVNYLVIVFASLAAGRLAAKFGTKPIIASGVLCALAGVLFLAANDPWFMAAMRVIYAVGYGFCQVGCVSTLNRIYTAPADRSRMMGLYNAVQSLIGAALSTVSGVFAVESIEKSYRIYWIYAPLLLLVLLFVPHLKPQAPEPSNASACEASLSKKKPGFGVPYWVSAICFAVGYYSLMWVSFYVSTYVVENGIGTAANAGTISALNTIGGCIGALSAAWLCKKLGNRLPVLAYAAISCVIGIHWLFPVLPLIYAVTILRGLFFVSTFTWALANLPSLVPPERAGQAVPLFTAGYAGAIFLSTYSVSLCQTLMNTTLYTPTLIVPTLLCLGAAVFQGWACLHEQRKTAARTI